MRISDWSSDVALPICKLTTQINIDGDPLLNDDFAYATREGLVPKITERSDEASSKAAGMDGPFAEIEFDFSLTALVDGVDNQVNEQRVRAEGCAASMSDQSRCTCASAVGDIPNGATVMVGGSGHGGRPLEPIVAPYELAAPGLASPNN